MQAPWSGWSYTTIEVNSISGFTQSPMNYNSIQSLTSCSYDALVRFHISTHSTCDKQKDQALSSGCYIGPASILLAFLQKRVIWHFNDLLMTWVISYAWSQKQHALVISIILRPKILMKTINLPNHNEVFSNCFMLYMTWYQWLSYFSSSARSKIGIAQILKLCIPHGEAVMGRVQGRSHLLPPWSLKILKKF